MRISVDIVLGEMVGESLWLKRQNPEPSFGRHSSDMEGIPRLSTGNRVRAYRVRAALKERFS